MITTAVTIKKIFKKEDSDYITIFAEPLDNKNILEIDGKYKTIKVGGKFKKDLLKEKTKITITINDFPNNAGFYNLLFEGKLPSEATFSSLGMFIMTTEPSESLATKVLKELRSNTNTTTYDAVWNAVQGKISFEELYKTFCEENISKNYKIISNHIASLYKNFKTQFNIYTFLSTLKQLGVDDEDVQYDILKNFKDISKLPEIAEKLKDNPYSLLDITNLKINTIDDIALKSGMKPNDDKRVLAYSEYNLKNLGATGRTWVYIEPFVKDSINGNAEFGIISLNTADYSFNFTELKRQMKKVARKGLWLSKDKNRIASRYYSDLELELSNIIKKLNSVEPVSAFNDLDIENAIKACETASGFKYSKEQRNAVRTALRDNISIIAGPAGTGKSTIARAICQVHKSYSIMTTALAGKATLRLEETTGLSGRTMHSNLARLEDEHFNANIIIIDEASMLGLDIVIEFFRKITLGTRVILLGDVAQLTPIGSGNIFADMLHSKYINSVMLQTVRRQALESNIIKFATEVRLQHHIEKNSPFLATDYTDFALLAKDTDTGISRAITTEFKKFIKTYPLSEIMIVTPYKAKGTVNNYDINNRMQKALVEANRIHTDSFKWLHLEEDAEKKFVIYVGDRVINTKNNYNCKDTSGNKVTVMNGSLGTVLKISKSKVLIDFDGIGEAEFTNYDLESILLGYSISTHKSQGSQAKGVIYALPAEIGRLGCCEQLYTGITRAQDKCVVIGTLNAINYCIETKELSTKQTLLLEFLDDLDEPFEATLKIAIDDDSKPVKSTKRPVHKPVDSTGNQVLEGQIHIDETLEEAGDEKLTRVAKGHIDKLPKAISSSEKEKLPKQAQGKINVHVDYSKYYDKNNERRRNKRRNKDGLTSREQSKLDLINKIKDLHSKGMKGTEIAKELGINKGTVSKYLKL